jgi:1-aminocyclopropane-1-carboxylate deaminase
MLEKFERYPLTFGPTPIERLNRLSEHLGGSVEIYAGLAFGGNKIRKLEYIIPDALASNTYAPRRRQESHRACRLCF